MNVEEIDIAMIEQHLKREGTGVSLPCKAGECTCYRVKLEDEDVPYIALWWEFQIDTANEDCRLISLLPSVAGKPRVKRLVEGDPTKGHGPADLRTLPNKEPTILTDDLASTLLYVIDGNNRMIAQKVSAKPFEEVPAFVCVWPKFRDWAYVPNYYKRRQPQKRVVSDSTIQIEYGDYGKTLLDFAVSLIERGQFGPATVMAHVACEINVERALAVAFKAKDIIELQPAVLGLLPGFNLGNSRIQELFSAMTGKQPQQQLFWDGFLKSATRRNRFVHNGKPVAESEARQTMEVARQLIQFLK